jgi:siroheme synthase-like protein
MDSVGPAERPALYPLSLDLSGRAVLVVGAGRVAARKVEGLLAAGALVTVVAPEVCEEINTLAGRPGFTVQVRRFAPGDVEGKWLVIAAAGPESVNRCVAGLAEQARIFCNVVDAPGLCSCQMPAVVRRGLLQIAISTGGASPALAASLRRRLEAEFGPPWAELVDALGELRRHYRARYPDEPATRHRLLREFVDSDVPALLTEAGEREAFSREVERWKSR